MTTTAVILIIISAFAHTGWNLIGKSRNPSAEFLLLANTLGCLFLSPVLLKYGYLLGYFPAKVWGLLIITGMFQALYYASLAEAYKFGDMSLMYPIMRSAPVLLVMLVNLFIGRIYELSVISIIGIILVIAGGLLLPLQRKKDINLRVFMKYSTILALLAAVGTCSYSIIDYQALHIISSSINMYPRTGGTLVYGLMEGISASFWLACFVFLNSGRRARFRSNLTYDMKSALLAGIGIYGAYTLVLIAMTLSKNVSYVVAFRQLGIPLATIFGVVGLKEPCYPAKITGVCVMLAGLVMVAIK